MMLEENCKELRLTQLRYGVVTNSLKNNTYVHSMGDLRLFGHIILYICL